MGRGNGRKGERGKGVREEQKGKGVRGRNKEKLVHTLYQPAVSFNCINSLPLIIRVVSVCGCSQVPLRVYVNGVERG